MAADEFGITEVFAGHLEMNLTHMRPEQAFEAAQHAVRAYLRSYEFVPLNQYKGSTGPVQYRMVVRKENPTGQGVRR